MSLDNPFEAPPVDEGDCGCGENPFSVDSNFGSGDPSLPPVEEMMADLERGGPLELLGRTHVKSAGPDDSLLPPVEQMMAELEGLGDSPDSSDPGAPLHELIALVKQNRGLKISISYDGCHCGPEGSGGPPPPV